MSSDRYNRPDLQKETLEDLTMLNFLIGEIPPPQGGEDAWLWGQARALKGKPMHRLLLAVIRTAREEDEILGIAGEAESLQAFTETRSEVFKTICDRALKRGDAAFFRHLADCIEALDTPQNRCLLNLSKPQFCMFINWHKSRRQNVSCPQGQKISLLCLVMR